MLPAPHRNQNWPTRRLGSQMSRSSASSGVGGPAQRGGGGRSHCLGNTAGPGLGTHVKVTFANRRTQPALASTHAPGDLLLSLRESSSLAWKTRDQMLQRHLDVTVSGLGLILPLWCVRVRSVLLRVVHSPVLGTDSGTSKDFVTGSNKSPPGSLSPQASLTSEIGHFHN